MGYTYGIFIYDNVASLDFVGPYEVFCISKYCGEKARVITIAETKAPIKCIGGLEVVPGYTFESAPSIDILIIPGAEDVSGIGEKAINWIQAQAEKTKYVAAVCTGALILQRAGLLRGRKATTHWMLVDTLAKDPEVTVLAAERYVRDGNIVTSQGVSAGIDMSLWLLGQLYSPKHAQEAARFLQYEPKPPYLE